RIEAPRRGLRRRAAAEILRLVRAGADGAEKRLVPRQGLFLSGPVALPGDREFALCFSPRDGEAGAEIPPVDRAARARRCALAHCRLSRVEAADPFQPAGHLQALSRTGRLAIRGKG